MAFNGWLLALLLQFITATRLTDAVANVSLPMIREWTAMGDSYASGLGAGPRITMLDNNCFRQEGAYPFQLNEGFGKQSPTFNFVACSGATFQEILDDQFLDTPQSLPAQPGWGNAPQFITITMGADEIGIQDVITTCIYSLPSSTTTLDCDQLIQRGLDQVNSDAFVAKAGNVIYTALNKGFQRYHPSFKVFVTGYAQFFNKSSPQCDNVTFKPESSPLAPQYLTRDRRQRINQLIQELNRILSLAVAKTDFLLPGLAYFVDYDAQFEGHRFCDRIEPNPDDPLTWFWNWGDAEDQWLERSLSNGRNIAPLNDTSNSSLTSPPPLVKRGLAVNSTFNATGNDTDPDIPVDANQLRVFHPKIQGHTAIMRVLANAISAAIPNDDVAQS